ncbi:MAG: double zinc ribbon domain-containing protein [Coriobacteriales bacterium]|nr:double zinc ribbon domain-containing protein [Coriobacteriales bacterium]
MHACELVRGLAELLWPTRCAVCDEPGQLLCERCASQLPLIDGNLACPWCGAPYGWLSCTECDPYRVAMAGPRAGGRDAPGTLGDGATSPFSFERARCAAEYRGGASRLVRVYKDGGERRLAPYLARFMAQALDGGWVAWADAIAYVPATPQAQRRRGFDHMALVACELGKLVSLPVLAGLARRKVLDQRQLGREERARNAAASVQAVDLELTGLRILLVDDVFTTGATLNAASAALLAAHAAAVRALTFARTW